MPIKVVIDGATTTLFNLQEAASFLGVSERTMRTYVKAGRIPAVKHRRRLYIWSRNLQEYLRGARTLRTYRKVEPPEYSDLDFSAPPDELWSAEGRLL